MAFYYVNYQIVNLLMKTYIANYLFKAKLLRNTHSQNVHLNESKDEPSEKKETASFLLQVLVLG